VPERNYNQEEHAFTPANKTHAMIRGGHAFKGVKGLATNREGHAFTPANKTHAVIRGRARLQACQ